MGRIEADDLYALAHLLEEYERNQGGDPDSGNCDHEQIWEENVINGNETVFDYLYDWFHNQEPPHECVTENYLIWMLDNNECSCEDLQRWMVGNLEEGDFTFVELGEDVDANRPWMHMD